MTVHSHTVRGYNTANHVLWRANQSALSFVNQK